MCRNAIIVVLLAAGSATAQRAVVPSFASPSGMSPSFSGNAGLVLQRPIFPAEHLHNEHLRDGVALLGVPWLADYGIAQPGQSPTVVVVNQPASASPEPKAEPKTPAAPLMIERQGDRFVRLGADDAAKRLAAANYVEKGHAPHTDSANAAIPPVSLVFRNGSREDVQSYTITGGVLYADGNYWQSGCWRKEIQLSALDIPSTIRTNQQRGVVFRVPSAPNEVIARP